jgi:hypothetical protein
LGKAVSGEANAGGSDNRYGYGLFTLYTADPVASSCDVAGGRIERVARNAGGFACTLRGPPNAFKEGSPEAEVPFTVFDDPVNGVAKLAIQGQEMLLREGEWSDWVSVRFGLCPVLANAAGICRFYLKRVQPYLVLYVSPPNIDPRVVFMVRDIAAVIASQAKMPGGRDGVPAEVLSECFEVHVAAVRRWLAGRPRMRVLYCAHYEVLRQPVTAAARVADFVGADLDAAAMARVVAPPRARYRHMPLGLVGPPEFD